MPEAATVGAAHFDVRFPAGDLLAGCEDAGLELQRALSDRSSVRRSGLRGVFRTRSRGRQHDDGAAEASPQHVPPPAGSSACITRSGSFGKGDAHELFVVPREQTAPGKGGVAPDDVAAEAFAGGVEHVEAAEFLI